MNPKLRVLLRVLGWIWGHLVWPVSRAAASFAWELVQIPVRSFVQGVGDMIRRCALLAIVAFIAVTLFASNPESARILIVLSILLGGFLFLVRQAFPGGKKKKKK